MTSMVDGVPITRDPPAIPALRTAGTDSRTNHILLWARTGTARVRIEREQNHELSAGQGLWVPAGTYRETTVDAGSVVVPLRVGADAASGAPDNVRRFEVRDEWHDWLMYHFSIRIVPNDRPVSQHNEVLDLLAPSSGPRSLSTSQPSDIPTPPPMPTTPAARMVAQQLLLDPALDLTLDEWASSAPSSPSTLRREFIRNTSMTFEEWRIRCRIAIAAEYLLADDDISHASRRVGFVSRNGFTRAFKKYTGTTPREFVALHSPASEPSQRVVAAHDASTLARAIKNGSLLDLKIGQTEPPATRAHTHANSIHVLTWMYRGTNELRIGDHTHVRNRGDAVWIPAGVEHSGVGRAGSIVLPIAEADPANLPLSNPLRVNFSPAWDDYLLHCAINLRTRLRPDGYDSQQILDLFREQLAIQRALSVPMPREPRARALATEFLHNIGRGDDGYNVSDEIQRSFRDETGLSFARWRHATRMRVARDLLVGGAKPVVVASRVGYSQLASFSRAFSRFHGMPPSTYQQQELGE
ncbi:MAG: helix-turn-helix domain-containing protein [Ancrocorticia sp.]